MKKYSKRIVLLCIMLTVIFASVVLYIFYRTGSEPTEMIRYFMGFITIELWSLAGIKKKEIKKAENETIAFNETFVNEDMRGD